MPKNIFQNPKFLIFGKFWPFLLGPKDLISYQDHSTWFFEIFDINILKIYQKLRPRWIFVLIFFSSLKRFLFWIFQIQSGISLEIDIFLRIIKNSVFDRFSKLDYQNLQKIMYYHLDKNSSILDQAKWVKINQKVKILDFGKYFWAKFKVFDPIIIRTFFFCIFLKN